MKRNKYFPLTFPVCFDSSSTSISLFVITCNCNQERGRCNETQFLHLKVIILSQMLSWEIFIQNDQRYVTWKWKQGWMYKQNIMKKSQLKLNFQDTKCAEGTSNLFGTNQDITGRHQPRRRHTRLLNHCCNILNQTFESLCKSKHSSWPECTNNLPLACGIINRLPLVPAESNRQAWPMAAPTHTVCTCTNKNQSCSHKHTWERKSAYLDNYSSNLSSFFYHGLLLVGLHFTSSLLIDKRYLVFKLHQRIIDRKTFWFHSNLFSEHCSPKLEILTKRVQIILHSVRNSPSRRHHEWSL